MRMPRPKTDTVQVTFRIPREWVMQAARLAKGLSRTGFQLTRTDSFRMAMAQGLIELQREADSNAVLKRNAGKRPAA
jgi:hypothetical protein